MEAYALSVARSYRGFASQGAARLDEVCFPRVALRLSSTPPSLPPAPPSLPPLPLFFPSLPSLRTSLPPSLRGGLGAG